MDHAGKEQDRKNLHRVQSICRLNQELVEELLLWRILVVEGTVPRYKIKPGAALNHVVTSTDYLLKRVAKENIQGK